MFTARDAKTALMEIGFKVLPFPMKSIVDGMNVELEHGTKHPILNVTNDDPVLTCKIALAHLYEDKDYYWKLKSLGL